MVIKSFVHCDWWLSTVRFISELDLTKHFSSGYKVNKLFMDPSGNHILISAVHKEREKDIDRDDLAADLLYINVTANKPRPVRMISIVSDSTTSCFIFKRSQKTEATLSQRLAGVSATWANRQVQFYWALLKASFLRLKSTQTDRKPIGSR